MEIAQGMSKNICNYRSRRKDKGLKKDFWADTDQMSNLACSSQFSGSEKGVFWKRGLFRKVHFPSRDSLEILENPRLENRGESDHFLEILENLEILEIRGILQ